MKVSKISEITGVGQVYNLEELKEVEKSKGMNILVEVLNKKKVSAEEVVNYIKP